MERLLVRDERMHTEYKSSFKAEGYSKEYGKTNAQYISSQEKEKSADR